MLTFLFLKNHSSAAQAIKRLRRSKAGVGDMGRNGRQRRGALRVPGMGWDAMGYDGMQWHGGGLLGAASLSMALIIWLLLSFS